MSGLDSASTQLNVGEPQHRVDVGNYLSAGFGGFLVGFGELLRSGSDSPNVTVLRISAVLREQFSASLSGGWVALLLLSIFAMILCAIYRPLSRKESFVLGFSVYAVLTAVAPLQEAKKLTLVKAESSVSFQLISSAIAAPPVETSGLRDYYFVFRVEGGSLKNKQLMVSVFDETEKHLLLSNEMDVSKIGRLQLPKGSYVLKFECKGCSSMRADLDVQKQEEAAIVTVQNSVVPLSLQRLFRAGIVDIEDVPDIRIKPIVEKFKAQVK